MRTRRLALSLWAISLTAAVGTTVPRTMRVVAGSAIDPPAAGTGGHPGSYPAAGCTCNRSSGSAVPAA